MSITVEQIDYHRNGISGEGFHVVLFHDDIENIPMMGVVFGMGNLEIPDECRVAVFNRDLLKQDVIAFGFNSFRGDHYAYGLYQAIRDWHASTDLKTYEHRVYQAKKPE